MKKVELNPASVNAATKEEKGEWKAVQGQTPIFKFTEAGQSLQGIYERREEKKMKDPDGKKGNVKTSWLYHLKGENGPVAFWGGFIIDEAFSEIMPGAEVRITFKGKQKTSSKRNVKIFEILYR